MEKTKIVYYAFPFHIDMVERTILQLKRASIYANTKDYLCLDIVLDISDDNFEWDKCSIPKQFFIDRFKTLEKSYIYCIKYENGIMRMNRIRQLLKVYKNRIKL